MSKNEKTWQDELKHFQYCQTIIRKNITRYEQEYETRHGQVKELYKAINSGDVELYNQLMTVSSLSEHAGNSLRKNKAALDRPYFGRIDYKDLDLERCEKLYIGKNGVFREKTDVLIADWRAPISSVYYENELGTGEYALPDESSIPIDLKLKRTYDVDGGKLNGYYDSDITSNDDLLIKYLSKNKDVVLGEIIATIQKEQNTIIRESPFANLIVQGVAGSGKTTVAMHRISYLLYNYKERFESNEYCIIGSNDLLLNYITSGLPELDVPNIKHLRMDEILICLCEKDWQKNNKLITPDETALIRCTLPFIQELEKFLSHKRKAYLDCSTLTDKELGIILTQTGNQALVDENPAYSINYLLTLMDERIKTRINFLMNDSEKYEIRKKLKSYQGYYKEKRLKNIIELYHEFLTNYSTEHGYDLNSHIKQIKNRKFDLYDTAALALIHYRVTQMKPNEAFGLLFLDEAQDFGISIYYVLKAILPNTYFTIMGDVSQNINYETGLNDWHDLRQLFLTGPKDKFLLLEKSYRNTIEISEYASKILEKSSLGQYKITPVIRHGLPVQEETFWSDLEMAEHIAQIIKSNEQKGYATTVIICQDEKESIYVKELLSHHTNIVQGKESNFQSGTMVLPIYMVKGLEFDTVILWNPDMKRSLDNPILAKPLYVAATRALHELYVFTLS